MKIKRILPAYPLFVKDPYFSIWSTCEEANCADTIFWTGVEKPVYGSIVCDGERYGFLGKREEWVSLKQTKLEVTAFSTKLTFECDAFILDVEFLSPLPPDDLELLACPVCFMGYKFTPKRRLKDVSVELAVREDMCYNRTDQEDRRDMRGDVMSFVGFETAYMGCAAQRPLSDMADTRGAEQGWYYVAGRECYFTDIKRRDRFITAADRYSDITVPVSGKLLFAYDDICSIFYYGEILRGYYFRNGKTITDALRESYAEYENIRARCTAFDGRLQEIVRASGYGEEYLTVLYAALRQTVAAHKLVEDKKGRALFLSKECDSGGCIATLDVTYPSMPLFLLFNPLLLEGMLYPIFDFAATEVWQYDFTPHDAGLYPACVGQYYGVKSETTGRYHARIGPVGGWYVLPPYYLYPKGSDIYEYTKQMPVEECGNMLILCALLYQRTGNTALLIKYADTLRKWAKYLENHGFMPEHQLCTDDFAGPSEKNVNLSVKASVGLGAYALIARALGDSEGAAFYEKIAKERAKKTEGAALGKSLPLAFGAAGETFGIKYNLLGDKLLGLGLFSAELFEREVDLYIRKAVKFGFPLDNRATYTKSDWMMWAAAMTNRKEKKEAIIGYINTFLTESPERLPFSDWYDTGSGKIERFINRTVQGAMFALLLAQFDGGIDK